MEIIITGKREHCQWPGAALDNLPDGIKVYGGDTNLRIFINIGLVVIHKGRRQGVGINARPQQDNYKTKENVTPSVRSIYFHSTLQKERKGICVTDTIYNKSGPLGQIF